MNSTTNPLESHFAAAPDFFEVYQQMQLYCFWVSESFKPSQTLIQSLLKQNSWESNLTNEIWSSNNSGVEVPAELPLNHSEGLKLLPPDGLKQATLEEVKLHTAKKSIKVNFSFKCNMVGTKY